jgi:hypothetical protein
VGEPTPGPWAMKGPSSGRGQYDDGGDYAVLDAEGFIVAEAFNLVGLGNPRPAKENARLIAAAPDLLAALVEIAGHWPSEDKTSAEDYRVLRGIARAAVAKAKGEA